MKRLSKTADRGYAYIGLGRPQWGGTEALRRRTMWVEECLLLDEVKFMANLQFGVRTSKHNQ